MRWLRIAILALSGALSIGCATKAPTNSDDSTYLTRSVTQAQRGISVSASVLDQDEIQEEFGGRLDLVGIQPVWLAIQNLSAYSYVLFLKSIDPDYFSPYEVARRSSAVSELSTEELYPFVRDREIRRFIPPGATVKGYVYTHLDEGLKAIKVDLVGNRTTESFSMAVVVPGLETDFSGFDSSEVYEDDPASLSESELRNWLRSLPCCPSSGEGTPGDPLNLVFIGRIEDIRAALLGQEWDVTAESTSSSVRRLISAFIFGSRYRYAPVSSLYLFGREQDMSLQKARAVIDERNHMRLWLAQVTLDGIPVWVGQISRDAGVKLSNRHWPPTTHVIDPAVDEARFYVEQDLLYSHRVRKLGFVGGVQAAPAENPSFNAEGDPYFTDGLRAVFIIGKRMTPLDKLEVLDWNLPYEMEPFRESIFAENQESPDVTE